MSDFLIDEVGFKIWYDVKSYEMNIKENISWPVAFPGQPTFFVRLHCEDGPARICEFGEEEYFMYGTRHCEYGPAVISPKGKLNWWIKNREYLFEDWCKELNKSEEEINFLKLKWKII